MVLSQPAMAGSPAAGLGASSLRSSALPKLSVAQHVAYATALEVQPDRELELFQLVQELLLAALLPPWREAVDSHRRIYFYNAISRETTWVHPLFEAHLSLVDACRRVISANDRQAASAEEILHLQREGEAELACWRKAADEDSRTFYYHVKTRETRWDDPQVWLTGVFRLQADFLLRVASRGAGSGQGQTGQETATAQNAASSPPSGQGAAPQESQQGHHHAAALQIRAEVAALRIQRAWRRYLPRLYLARKAASREAAALRIQRAWRCYRQQLVLARSAAARRARRAAAQEAAAVRIQRAWRRYLPRLFLARRAAARQARRAAAEEAAAVRIQRAWRRYLPRLFLARRAAARKAHRAATEEAAALRIQRAWRRYLSRLFLARKAAAREAAALRIQRAWCRHRRRVVLAREAAVAKAREEAALAEVAAATQLQRWFRRCLERLRVERARKRRAAEKAAAAARIQRWFRRLLGRRRAGGAGSASAAVEEAAAARIQRWFRRHLEQLRAGGAGRESSAKKVSLGSGSKEDRPACPPAAPSKSAARSCSPGTRSEEDGFTSPAGSSARRASLGSVSEEDDYPEDFESLAPSSPSSPAIGRLRRRASGNTKSSTQDLEDSFCLEGSVPPTPASASSRAGESPHTPASASSRTRDSAAATGDAEEEEAFHSLPPTPESSASRPEALLAGPTEAADKDLPPMSPLSECSATRPDGPSAGAAGAPEEELPDGVAENAESVDEELLAGAAEAAEVEEDPPVAEEPFLSLPPSPESSASRPDELLAGAAGAAGTLEAEGEEVEEEPADPAHQGQDEPGEARLAEQEQEHLRRGLEGRAGEAAGFQGGSNKAPQAMNMQGGGSSSSSRRPYSASEQSSRTPMPTSPQQATPLGEVPRRANPSAGCVARRASFAQAAQEVEEVLEAESRVPSKGSRTASNGSRAPSKGPRAASKGPRAASKGKQNPQPHPSSDCRSAKAARAAAREPSAGARPPPMHGTPRRRSSPAVGARGEQSARPPPSGGTPSRRSSPAVGARGEPSARPPSRGTPSRRNSPALAARGEPTARRRLPRQVAGVSPRPPPPAPRGAEEALKRNARAAQVDPGWMEPRDGRAGGPFLRRLRRRCRNSPASPHSMVHLPALARQVDRAEELKFQLLEQGKRNLYDAYADIFHEMLAQDAGRGVPRVGAAAGVSPSPGSQSSPVLTAPAANMGRRAQALAALSLAHRETPQGAGGRGPGGQGRVPKASPAHAALARDGRLQGIPRPSPAAGGRAGLVRVGAAVVGRSAPVLPAV
uniref:WW domain-containing protein n=1 Tax=Alexandrium monilatum TaxID=311494 RepID=A0A7S4Q8D8_9DINO